MFAREQAKDTLLFNEKKLIEGKVLEIQLAPDYQIYLIQLENGEKLLFDTAEVKLRKLSLNENGKQFKNFDPVSEGRLKINSKKAKLEICKRYQALRTLPEFLKAESFLENQIHLDRMIHVSNIKCISAMGAFTTSWAPWKYSVSARALGQSNFVLEHGDNFYMSIPLMASIHHCLNTTSSGPRLWNRHRAVALGTAANLLEEVSVSGKPIFTTFGNQGTRETTDWADLSAGMSGVAVYAAWAKYSEKTFDFKFSQVCK